MAVDGIPERELTLQYKSPDSFIENVVAVDTSNDIVTVSGDQTSVVEVDDEIEIKGSTGNDGTFTISNVAYDGGNDETDITVSGDIADATADGVVFANVGSPSVADGTEIKVFAESIKEIYQKEPQLQTIRKGSDTHYKGDETLVVDTMNDQHKFEVTGWVYSNKQDKHSLDSSIQIDGGEKAQTTTQLIQAEDFDSFIPLGDTGIIEGTATVQTHDGTTLTEGTDYEINYDRGEIKFFNTNDIQDATRTSSIGGVWDLGTRTIIADGFQVEYDFDASAQNIASLVRRMGQLGNPFVMRLDKKSITAPSGEESGRDFVIIPKKIQIVSQASKPDEFKVELELRKGNTDAI